MEGKDDVKHNPTVSHAQTSSPGLVKNLGNIKPTLGYKSKSLYYTKNNHFPDCLLLEILYRVPVKSTFRFKCVSKNWLSLISDPSFKRKHHSRLRDSPLWTLHYRFVDGIIPNIPSEYNKVNFVTSKHFMFNSPDFPFTFISSIDQQKHQQESKKFHVTASCNDLLLIYRRGVYYVCSPFTNQWIALPPCLNKSSQGLGFISQTKNGVTHYMVVMITNYSHSNSLEMYYRTGYDMFQLEIFSSESGKWKKSKISLPRPINLETPLMGAVPYNGILHWIDNPSGIIIAYNPFDDGNECCFFDLPMERENWRMGGLNGVLAVCQGHLRYFEIGSIFLRPGEFESWSVWVLKDYVTGEWCLEHRAQYRKICSFDPHPDIHVPQRTFMPIAFHPLDMDIMYFWCKGGYILSFNLQTGLFEDEIYCIPDAGLVCWWTVFSIEVPPSPTLVPQPCWKTITEEKVERTKIDRLKRQFKLCLNPLCHGMIEN